MLLLSALLLGVQRFASDDRRTGRTPHIDLQSGPGLRVLGGHIGHADAALQAGREGAAGDDAASLDRVALAGDPGPVDLERHELLLRSGSPRRGDGLGADEPGLLTARPA